jgi:hypothetical protein
MAAAFTEDVKLETRIMRAINALMMNDLEIISTGQ